MCIRDRILGLAIGNGCTALAGSILAQQAESASVSIGTGMVVQALAAVIIGTSVFGRIKKLKSTSAVLLGTILYKAVLLIAMPVSYTHLSSCGRSFPTPAMRRTSCATWP